MIAKFIAEQARAAGMKLKLPAETLAAIMSITSIGFQDAAYLNAEDGALYQTFLELILPAILESGA